MAVVDYGKGTQDVDIAALEAQLKQGAASQGVTYDPSDLQGILRNISYDTGGTSLDTATQNALSTYHDRATNVPGDEDGDGLPDGLGTSKPSSGGYPRDGGTASTNRQFDDLMGVFKGLNTQTPDVGLPEYNLPNFADFQLEVPGENMSPAIDDTLLSIMGGENTDPLGLEGQFSSALSQGPQDPLDMVARLKAYLDETAGGGVNSTRLLNRQESARENLTRGQSAALADLRAVLADRGLISLPGSPQGMELDSTSRAFEPLQRSYLSELRQAMTDESKLADQARSDALGRGQSFTEGVNAYHSDLLSKATGWSQGQVAQRLSAANTAQERQRMMSDVALQTLTANMSWNKFLAEFGLNREKVAEDIRQGRINAIMPVLQMFQGLLSQSRGGYI